MPLLHGWRRPEPDVSPLDPGPRFFFRRGSTPTLLVTTGMALSIAEVPGKLDEALAQLEELLVGAEDG